MKYITLRDLIYSGLPKDTRINIYNNEGKKIYSEEAAYVNENLKDFDVYDIDILGEKNIKVQIDTDIANTFIE